MYRNRRDRLVIFRLSQDEYQLLKAASERHGARNLSDFTRGEVLNALNSRPAGNPAENSAESSAGNSAGNGVEQAFSSMEQSMAELKEIMLHLQSVLEGLNNAKSTVAT
jgi:hypothetical protein